MKVVQQYCWKITQAAGQFCCDQSGSGVSEVVFL